jgi:hypothetical protein
MEFAVCGSRVAGGKTEYIGQDDNGALAGRQQLQGGDEGERAVVPGSARILESVRDERNALILVTVEAEFGSTKTTLPRPEVTGDSVER